MDKSTLICRCEEISVQEIEDALRQGCQNHDDIKRLTRCGMGPCQAKICRVLVADVIAEQTHQNQANIAVPRLRVPLRPTTIGVLAAYHEGNTAVKSVLDEIHTEERGDKQ